MDLYDTFNAHILVSFERLRSRFLSPANWHSDIWILIDCIHWLFNMILMTDRSILYFSFLNIWDEVANEEEIVYLNIIIPWLYTHVC